VRRLALTWYQRVGGYVTSDYEIPPPHSAPYWIPPGPIRRETDGFSIAALVLGILPVMGGLLGIVFGAIGHGRTRDGLRDGRGMAIAGLTLGIVWMIATVMFFVFIPVFAFHELRTTSQAVLANAPGTVAVDDARLGDCVQDSSDFGGDDRLPVVPCDVSHYGEVYAVFSLRGTTYPGDIPVENMAGDGCDSRLDPYLGRLANARIGWDYDDYTPTAETWRDGDRHVVCVLFRTDGVQLVGSVHDDSIVQG
jgi:hypothetical protein